MSGNLNRERIVLIKNNLNVMRGDCPKTNFQELKVGEDANYMEENRLESQERVKTKTKNIAKWGLTASRPEFSDSLGVPDLSFENCNCLKGLFSIVILLHHLCQHTGILKGSVMVAIIQSLGYLSVAMFFFLSGYGLSISIQKEGYTRFFIKRKIAPFYIIIVLLVAIYAIVAVITGRQLTYADILKSMTFGGTIIVNGWYLQVQLGLYILYYAAHYITRKDSFSNLIIFGGVFTFVFYAVLSDISLTRYESILAFVFGIFWTSHQKLLNCLNTKAKWFACMIIFLIIFGVTWLLQLKLAPNLLYIPVKMISSILFVIVVLIAICEIRINYSFTRWLGRYSFEIYVLQGVFLTFFHSDCIYVHNNGIYILLVVISTFIISIAFYPIVNAIYRIARNN